MVVRHERGLRHLMGHVCPCLGWVELIAERAGFLPGEIETNGWTLLAITDRGKLEGSYLWDVTFSARAA